MDVDKGKEIVRKWGFNSCVGVSCVGLSSGLLLFWDDNLHVMIKSMKKNVVNAYISDHYHNNFWITCLYRNPKQHLRQEVWEQLLVTAKNLSNEDEWLVLGDFNQTLHQKISCLLITRH